MNTGKIMYSSTDSIQNTGLLQTVKVIKQKREYGQESPESYIYLFPHLLQTVMIERKCAGTFLGMQPVGLM